MADPIQRYRTKSRDRQRELRNSLRSIERLQQEVYCTKQTISSATDDHKGEMNRSQQSRERLSRRRADNAKVQPRSKSRDYRSRPFGDDGYCRLHPDVRLAKMKAGGWKVVHEKCHKCLRRTNSPSTVSLTGDSHDSNRRHQKQSQKDTHRGSSSRGRRRETNSMDEHKPTKQQSKSKSIRSRSKSLRRKVQQLTPKRTVCVDGAPFDKSGRCFVHNHIKLASKKLLGGWRIHFRFCPECAEDDGNEKSNSVYSDISGLSQGSFTSGYEDRSVASRGDSSVRSSRSCKSTGSQRSNWSSKQSRKRIDDSFLPLDDDGYCLHHPDVQLAETCRKGGWNVLLDFCPECAEETLIIGGPLPRPRRSSHYSSRSSVASSVKSGRSARSSKSAESEGTYVERMPYIDGEGQTGHYSGHVNGDGKPSGRGKMRYKSGVWEGVWEEGTKIHGKIIVKKGKTKASSSDRHQSKSEHRHSHRDEPRHEISQRKIGSRRSRHKHNCDER
mmetsp:Transcript_9325/g.15949  ORF Transcript_9325/g.15949 Transcript_9325/m.15949 type:complete len:499 (-) Transcript_9325:429-1925(-)